MDWEIVEVDSHTEDLIERLEIEQAGLKAKISSLLRWGALILTEIDNCRERINSIESELSNPSLLEVKTRKERMRLYALSRVS